MTKRSDWHPNQKSRPVGIQDLRRFSMSGNSNVHLSRMLWLLFLPIFEARLLPKPTGGLKLQITQRGLAYAKSVAMEMLLSQLENEPIPDQHSTFRVPQLGDVSVSFSNIQIQQLEVGDSEASFDKGTGVRLAIRNAQIAFCSNWEIKHLFGEDNGTLQSSLVVPSVSTLLALDVDDGGRPLVRSISCSANIQDLQLTFSGSNSHQYNSIFRCLKRSRISSLNQEVCAEVKDYVDQFSHDLRNTKFWAEIDRVGAFDYSLVGKPEITEDQCNLDFKGKFFLVGQRQRSPLVPTPIILPNRSPSMAVVGISDFLINSAAFVYFTGNRLQVKYTDKELKRQFPEMPMEVHVAAQKAPKLHFHPGGLDATILGRAEAFVVLPNSSLVPVFTLGVESNFTGQIFLKAGRLGSSFARVGGSVALNGLHLSQEWSRIGEIPVSHLEGLLKIAGHGALFGLNRKLRAGKSLPNFYSASLMGPEVSMHEGFMLIETDLQVSLPNSVL